MTRPLLLSRTAAAACLAAILVPGAGLAQEARQEAPPSVKKSRPKTDDSNNGYIDNAIVGTQLRLRIDFSFDSDRPDRAEFLYGKCDCFARNLGQDAASPGPAFDADFQEIELAYEHALTERFSLFGEIPLRSVEILLSQPLDPDRPNLSNSGLGDLRAGFKYALIARRDRYLTLQTRAYLETGDADDALGTGHSSIEPGLLYFGELSERSSIAAEIRYWHPLSGSSQPGKADNPRELRIENADPPDPPLRNDDFAGDVLRFGLGFSRDLEGARFRFTPVVELVGWYVLDGYSTPATAPPDNPHAFIDEADGDTIVNLKLGTRIRTDDRGSLYVGWGQALTSEVWYEGIFRFEYRYSP